MTPIVRSTLLAFLIVALALPCCTAATEPTGPTGATCPNVARPTYADFGRPFFASYCTSCHAPNVPDRHGAPRGFDFDSEPAIAQHAREIDAEAASGPHAQNSDMPDMSGPVHVAPSEADRERLGAFLACERIRSAKTE